jgi:ABC-2 type transport system permease protein
MVEAGMIRAFRAELRKFMTVRFSYVITIMMLALVAFASFMSGYQSGPPAANGIESNLINSSLIIAQFAAIVGVVMLAQEYRNNTITYSFTYTNSRIKVILAKVLMLLLYVLVSSVAYIAVLVTALTIGWLARGYTAPAEHAHLWLTMAKTVVYISGFGMVGLLLAALLRNMTFCIIILFVYPTIVEPLLSVLLKGNAAYLPFTALRQFVEPANAPGIKTLKPLTGLLVFGMYLLVGWVIALILLKRRDAS